MNRFANLIAKHSIALIWLFIISPFMWGVFGLLTGYVYMAPDLFVMVTTGISIVCYCVIDDFVLEDE